MKGKKIFSTTIAAAFLLMNVPMNTFAIESVKSGGSFEVISAEAVPTPTLAVSTPTLKTAEAPAPTTAEPYVLSVDDRLRYDFRTVDGKQIDEVSIWGFWDRSFLDNCENITIPDTIPVERPVYDEDGRQKTDSETGEPLTETVDIPVTMIDSGLFEGCTNLRKVTLGKNIKDIGAGVFRDCVNLTEIVYPEGCHIESFASTSFINTAISEVYIPDDMTEIPGDGYGGAFMNCKYLTTVHIGENSKLTKIGDRAFEGSGLTSIELPDTVSEIGQRAFLGCPLKEFRVPNALTAIPEYCFGGLNYEDYPPTLEKLIWGDDPHVKSIGGMAFYGTKLTEVVIPDSVESLGDRCFAGIKTLTSITLGSGLKTIPNVFGESLQNVTTLHLSEGLEEIGERAFEHNVLSEVTIPSTVKRIGARAFYGYPDQWNDWDGTPYELKGSPLSKITFAEGSQLEYIGESAFRGLQKLKTLTLPVSTTPFMIDICAFQQCSALRSIDLGNCKQLGTLTDWRDNGVFTGCGSLRDVNFGDSIELIGSYTFAGTGSLVGPIVFPDSLKTIGISAFHENGVLENVTFNEGLETIGNWAFCGCDLKEIILPDTVTSCGDCCFRGNINCGKVKISAGMTEIPFMFLDCCTQASVVYAVRQGSHNFGVGNGQLKELVIPDNIKAIGGDAFDSCYALETIDFGKVEDIGAGAFACEPLVLNELVYRGILEEPFGSLKSIKMSPNIKGLGRHTTTNDLFHSENYNGVFENQGIFEGLVLPDTVELIGVYAFANCPSLHEFTMGKNLDTVGDHAFDGCKNLTEITFADEGSTTFGDWVFGKTGVTEITIPGWLDTVPSNLFNGSYSLSKVVVEDGIVEIDDAAFADTGVQSISLPNTLRFINDNAFNNSRLTEITLPESLQTIGASAFWTATRNDRLHSVTIPESVKSIGNSAFGYYRNTDKTYQEIVEQAIRDGVTVQSLLPPAKADTEFVLYGNQKAEEYAIENGMIYGGKSADDPLITVTTTTTGSDVVTTTTTSSDVTTTTSSDTTSEPVESMGDVNSDGFVDSSDAAMVLREYAQVQAGKSEGFTPEQKAVADFNKDDLVDSSDAALILKAYAQAQAKQ